MSLGIRLQANLVYGGVQDGLENSKERLRHGLRPRASRYPRQLSIYLCVYLSVYLSVCLSVYLSICLLAALGKDADFPRFNIKTTEDPTALRACAHAPW